jgi:hypothetical protein
MNNEIDAAIHLLSDKMQGFSAGGLNKVTPFQLRQFLVEAGFVVNYWYATKVTNKLPCALRRILYEQDLRAVNILFAADKPT